MNQYVFFAEYRDLAKLEACGTVVAIDITVEAFLSNGVRCQEGAVAIWDHANSDVCWSAASVEYLVRYCTRISEQEAGRIHPKMLTYLKAGLGESMRDAYQSENLEVLPLRF